MAIVLNRNYQGILIHTASVTRFLFNHVQCTEVNPQNIEFSVWEHHLIPHDF